MKYIRRCLWAFLFLLLPLLIIGCEVAKQPSYVQEVVLEGDSYSRGYQHGSLLGNYIRSIYTRLLDDSLIPYLNREQVNVASVLSYYLREEYCNNQFSRKMLLESGYHLYKNYIPETYRQEILGVADGACDTDEKCVDNPPLTDEFFAHITEDNAETDSLRGEYFKKVLILNTFLDTMMGFRAVTAFIKQIQTPYITQLEFVGDMNDGVDNDGNGETDEEGEGAFDKYTPLYYAMLVEAPKDAAIRIVLEDRSIGQTACNDPNNVEPVGSEQMDSRCVNDICIKDECKGQDFIDRECITEEGLTCLYPRVHISCFDPMCFQASDPQCMNPDSVRFQIGDTVYTSEDEELEIKFLEATDKTPEPDDHGEYTFEGCQNPLEVVFRPEGGFPEGEAVAFIIQAGDQSPIYTPEPFHNRFMRDEHITFTTKGFAEKNGYGLQRYEVKNRAVDDGRSQPPSIAFALRDTAVSNDVPLLAHHYSLLDSNLIHEHSVHFTQIPTDGYPHTYMGWAGICYGFSGMNTEGMTYAMTNSDSLDNPLVGGVVKVILDNLGPILSSPDNPLDALATILGDTRLLATGLPIGFSGREMLRNMTTVDEAIKHFYLSGQTYGWNMLVMDKQGEMAAIELDGGFQNEVEKTEDDPIHEVDGFFYYQADPEDDVSTDEFGNLYGSINGDDLFIGSHYEKNRDDIRIWLDTFSLTPQSEWTGFYFRSLRAFHVLGDLITEYYGKINVPKAIEILRDPGLVDIRDSMSTAVFEPTKGIMNWASGDVPVTDQEFIPYNLNEAVAGKGVQK